MVEKKVTKTVKKEKAVETPKKKATAVRKPKALVLEVAKEESYEKRVNECECWENCRCNCKKWHTLGKIMHGVELLVLLTNLVLLSVLLCQVKRINYWTDIWNGWEEHVKTLENLYNTDEYKNYVEDQIYNLESTLQHYSDDAYDYDGYRDNEYNWQYENEDTNY